MFLNSLSAMQMQMQMPPQTRFPFFLLLALFTSTIAAASTAVSYADHCSSLVPESAPTIPDYAAFTLPQSQNGFYVDVGDDPNEASSYKCLSFQTPVVHETEAEGVFKLSGSLTLQDQSLYSPDNPKNVTRQPRWGNPLTFSLSGFWSNSTGNLCMTGTARLYSQEGKLLDRDLKTVLKLVFFQDTNISTGMVTGTLEILNQMKDSRHIQPISIIMFPETNYTYSLSSSPEKFKKEFPKEGGQSLGLRHGGSLCSMLSGPFNALLEYPNGCSSSTKCNPFAGGVAGALALPSAVSIASIQCSNDQKRLRVLIAFPKRKDSACRDCYGRPFDPNTTLVGEGYWDSENNRLYIMACRIVGAGVKDCSFRLSLRFPAILSLQKSSSVVGKIWTIKSVNDPGFFERITYRSVGKTEVATKSFPRSVPALPGSKYEYTTAKNSCPAETIHDKGETLNYPDAGSYEMSFQASIKIKNSRETIGWADIDPLSIGDQLFDHTYSYYNYESPEEKYISPVNISYKVNIRKYSNYGGGGFGSDLLNSSFGFSDNYNYNAELTAEGVYDNKTGKLCLVACRDLDLVTKFATNVSMDCKILVKFSFPAANQKTGRRQIKGSIESTREASDPLYFGPLELVGSGYSMVEAEWSIWRLDFETAMVLASKTLLCIFSALQIIHVKRHQASAHISLLMLSILALGQMVPLLLNFEALLHQNRRHFWRRSEWLEGNEVLVRVASMGAFLTQLLLLHRSWSAKLSQHDQKDVWVAEKKALFLSTPLYLIGAVASLLAQKQQPILSKLKSYGGLVLDGFLVPQILLNVFANPMGTEKKAPKALSNWFYIGTSLARLVPHAYDLYRAGRFGRDLDGSYGYMDEYVYAVPGSDFYSPVWDVAIAFGVGVFAAVIYLQQRFGGRCVLPRRLRATEAYAKVTTMEEYEKVPTMEEYEKVPTMEE